MLSPVSLYGHGQVGASLQLEGVLFILVLHFVLGRSLNLYAYSSMIYSLILSLGSFRRLHWPQNTGGSHLFFPVSAKNCMLKLMRIF